MRRPARGQQQHAAHRQGQQQKQAKQDKRDRQPASSAIGRVRQDPSSTTIPTSATVRNGSPLAASHCSARGIQQPRRIATPPTTTGKERRGAGPTEGFDVRWVRRGNRHSTIPTVRPPRRAPKDGLGKPSATATSSTATAYDGAPEDDAEPDALENAKMLLQDHTGMAQ